MRAFSAALANLGCVAAGVYLITHDHVKIGGWVVILSVLIGLGYETAGKGEK